MDTQETPQKTSFWKRKWFIYTVGILFGVGVLTSLTDSNNTPTPTAITSSVAASPSPSFATLSRARFDDILKSAPELKAINCIDSACDSVVYFDYTTVPDDLDFVIRGNAATFSKFKLDNTGVSNVSITARLDGRTLETCSAGQGKVKECH